MAAGHAVRRTLSLPFFPFTGMRPLRSSGRSAGIWGGTSRRQSCRRNCGTNAWQCITTILYSFRRASVGSTAGATTTTSSRASTTFKASWQRATRCATSWRRTCFSSSRLCLCIVPRLDWQLTNATSAVPTGRGDQEERGCALRVHESYTEPPSLAQYAGYPWHLQLAVPDAGAGSALDPTWLRPTGLCLTPFVQCAATHGFQPSRRAAPSERC